MKSTDSLPYVFKNDFINRYSIYSIDLSNQPQKIPGAKRSLMLNAHFNDDIPAPKWW
jgi:hypothetical protein